MEIKTAQNAVSISEFYKGRNVFITGATGFVGKLLIHKLLQDCPDIRNIYVLIRPKKGKNIKERVDHIIKDLLFDNLKRTAAHQLSKLVPMCGDCSQLNLGLSEADYKTLTSSVSVIYHVAASVRFDDALKYAIILNTRGTREVAQLALKTPGLSILVHVSTTFCNCAVANDIKEQLYPAPDDWKKAIKIAEEFNNDQLVAITSKYLGLYPNTYTFTKALGEHVIKDLCQGKIQTVICRPSIVVSSLKDPVKGWIDNFNGPVGLLVACGKGLLRTGYQNKNIQSDFVPVDVTVKAMIVASWEYGLKQQQERDQVHVLHCSSGYHKWMTLGEVIRVGRDTSDEIPLNDSIWVPKGFITSCKFYAYFCTVFFHLLPAFFLDLGLKFAGKKPMLLRLQTKIYNASLQLRYFTWQEWNFCNEKFINLQEKIPEEDLDTWTYEFRTEDANIFMKHCMIGARKYLLHESEESLPAAKIHYKRMYWLDKVTMFILYGSLFWLVIHFEITENIVNKIYNAVTYYFDGEYV